MNLLLFEAAEVSPDGAVVLLPDDPRAAHLRDVLRGAPGDVFRAGVVDGPIGEAVVVGVEAGGFSCRFQARAELQSSPARIDLLLALPRPKALKRLYAPLASLGVAHVYLTSGERVERYYFDSHAITEAVYRPLLLEGMSQAKTTHLPRVTVHKSLRAVVERLGREEATPRVRLLCDVAPHATIRLRDQLVALAPSADERILLAVGPEGGWVGEERERFVRAGFCPVTLGARSLRTDVAVISLCAIVDEILAELTPRRTPG